jgi:copper chaperone CopZ
MSKIEIDVKGMTCGHCAQSVTSELVSIEGVTKANVDHASGKALVEVEGEISDDELREAVSEAGYEAVSISRG